MPCPCEKDNMIAALSTPVELDIAPIEKYTTFQGELWNFSLYVDEIYVIRIEKIREGEYLIVWCDNT